LLRVLGGQGAWPSATQACSGFVVEHDGFRLVIDLGYVAFPRLLDGCEAHEVDAVFISHGHPDHCADLNPLLRARALGEVACEAMPIYAPVDALNAVLALDRPGMLDDAYALREFVPGAAFEIGPFQVESRLLPHWLPNAGIRLTAGGTVLAYTGDTGPSPEIARLAHGADLLIADASYPERVPADASAYQSSAAQAGQHAAAAHARRLLLTHLSPGTSRQAALDAARQAFSPAGSAPEIAIAIADDGLVIDLNT